jgi:hypothetical protein
MLGPDVIKIGSEGEEDTAVTVEADVYDISSHSV